MSRDNILRGQARKVVNNVHSYANRCKVAVQAYVFENTEKASVFNEVFSVTGCNFLKLAKVTADMVGVCERTVRRYHSYQMTREDLEPEFGRRGRKKERTPGMVFRCHKRYDYQSLKF